MSPPSPGRRCCPSGHRVMAPPPIGRAAAWLHRGCLERPKRRLWPPRVVAHSPPRVVAGAGPPAAGKYLRVCYASGKGTSAGSAAGDVPATSTGHVPDVSDGGDQDRGVESFDNVSQLAEQGHRATSDRRPGPRRPGRVRWMARARRRTQPWPPWPVVVVRTSGAALRGPTRSGQSGVPGRTGRGDGGGTRPLALRLILTSVPPPTLSPRSLGPCAAVYGERDADAAYARCREIRAFAVKATRWASTPCDPAVMRAVLGPARPRVIGNTPTAFGGMGSSAAVHPSFVLGRAPGAGRSAPTTDALHPSTSSGSPTGLPRHIAEDTRRRLHDPPRLAPARPWRTTLERAAAVPGCLTAARSRGTPCPPASHAALFDWESPVGPGGVVPALTPAISCCPWSTPPYCLDLRDSVSVIRLVSGLGVVDFHGPPNLSTPLKDGRTGAGLTWTRRARLSAGVGANEEPGLPVLLDGRLDCRATTTRCPAPTPRGVREGVVVNVRGGSTGVGIIRAGCSSMWVTGPGRAAHHLN